MAALQRVLLAGGRAVLSGGEDAGGSVQGVQWRRWSGGHGPAYLDNLSDLALGTTDLAPLFRTLRDPPRTPNREESPGWGSRRSALPEAPA